MLGDVVQIVLGVQCGHAAAAGGGDGLTVDAVLDVTAGEDAWHAGLGAVVRDDVAVRVELESGP